MNNIGNIKDIDSYFKKNKTEIKKVKKTETGMSFKNHLKQEQTVCSCFSLKEKDILNFKNIDELIKITGASTRCTACLNDLKKYF